MSFYLDFRVETQKKVRYRVTKYTERVANRPRQLNSVSEFSEGSVIGNVTNIQFNFYV